jgi:peptidylprolyl isomerase
MSDVPAPARRAAQAAPPRLLTALALVLVLALTACAGDGGDDAAGSAGSEAPSSETSSEEPAADASDVATDDAAAGDDADDTATAEVSDDARGVEVAGELGEKPEITLPGGEPPTELVVVDLVEGDGEEAPSDATVSTHYVGVSWLNEGVEFDSSWDRGDPISFPLDGVIQGWGQGIPGMKVGGRRLLIIPPDLAYGPSSPSPDIAADDTLVFVIDLVEVVPPPEPIEPGTDAMGVEVSGGFGETPEITLPGGEPPTELVVVDLVEGDGEEVPVGATVTTDYAGVSWLNEGAVFDSSFERGEPATFPLSGVIPGWTQGLPGMKVGGRRLLIIPPDLAYGDAAPSPDIAAGDTLVFVIDMVDVQ